MAATLLLALTCVNFVYLSSSGFPFWTNDTVYVPFSNFLGRNALTNLYFTILTHLLMVSFSFNFPNYVNDYPCETHTAKNHKDDVSCPSFCVPC